MATHARQQYFADESSLSKERREFSIADEIQEKIDSVEEGAQVNKIETVKVNGTALVPDTAKAVNVEVPDVIDNLYTITADDALSAKQGKILYDYIQNLQTIGRFLSNWDTATGLPITNPSESPYLYKAGDYYRVSNIATSPAANYKPNGSSYTIGVASTTVESLPVAVSDLYLYDGTDWILLSNSGSAIAIDSSLSTTSTNPVENRVITNALNGKHPGEISNVAPSSPVEGMLWYDTVNDELKTYDGTAWQTEGTKMVVLEYDVSTWQNFIDAYNENAIVYCKVSSGSSGYRMAFMAYTAGTAVPTEVEFQYYRSRSSHSQSSTQLDEVYVYKLTNAGVWTTTQRDIGAKMIAGAGIGITFNSSGATINNTGVTSVNGNTGAVTLDADDISDSTTTNKFVTANDKTTWNNKLGVSTDTGNLLSAGDKLWLGSTADFSSIVSPDANTMYIQYVSDSPTPPSPLPAEYQEVEWIGSSGTQRIDTGVRPDDLTYGFECKFKFTTLSGDWNVMNLGGTSVDDHRYGRGGFNRADIQVGNPMIYSPSNVNINYALDTETEHTTKYNYNGNLNFERDDTVLASELQTGSYTYNVNWNIFCQAYGSGAYARYGRFNLYYMKIFHGTTLIRDFVPCYRKLDSVIGLYDLVNDIFYTNDGDGTFTKGPDAN